MLPLYAGRVANVALTDIQPNLGGMALLGAYLKFRDDAAALFGKTNAPYVHIWFFHTSMGESAARCGGVSREKITTSD